jgi:hypothetical protein
MPACELALAGVSPVVLDKDPGPTSEPKANGLVGQVIRLLDMRGLYHAFGGAEGPARADVCVEVRGDDGGLRRRDRQPDAPA